MNFFKKQDKRRNERLKKKLAVESKEKNNLLFPKPPHKKTKVIQRKVKASEPQIKIETKETRKSPVRIRTDQLRK